jgi:hypothetical protein
VLRPDTELALVSAHEWNNAVTRPAGRVPNLTGQYS